MLNHCPPLQIADRICQSQRCKSPWIPFHIPRVLYQDLNEAKQSSVDIYFKWRCSIPLHFLITLPCLHHSSPGDLLSRDYFSVCKTLTDSLFVLHSSSCAHTSTVKSETFGFEMVGGGGGTNMKLNYNFFVVLWLPHGAAHTTTPGREQGFPTGFSVKAMPTRGSWSMGSLTARCWREGEGGSAEEGDEGQRETAHPKSVQLEDAAIMDQLFFFYLLFLY